MAAVGGVLTLRSTVSRRRSTTTQGKIFTKSADLLSYRKNLEVNPAELSFQIVADLKNPIDFPIAVKRAGKEEIIS